MQRGLLNRAFLFTGLIVTAIAAYSFIFTHEVDFNTEIKPLFNKKCIACHGGVKKKAGFSLLFRSEALSNTESGKPAIVPGDPDASEMIRRISIKDPDERMPYKEHPLPDDEIALLRKWIKQGAKWGDHWAYVAVKNEPMPKKGWLWGLFKKNDEWARNEIDHFIRNKLNDMDLKPSIEADPEILARRLALDIIGMPANEKLTQKFTKDPSEENYKALVDTLLNSPAYGERWTAMWLDLARYADTKGYERDDRREIWRYRDWLIKSFNDDKPYDSFLIEQIAGDLLPDASDEQIIATAFHRNTMTNDEGGTDNEEFRTAAVIDRVNTTWEVLEGTTFSCVQCHSHPYDPFKHEDYYRFMAFFNNTRDEDSYAEYPLLYEFKDEDTIKYNEVKLWLKKYGTESEQQELGQFIRTRQPSINSLVADSLENSALADTKWLMMRKNSGARIREVGINGHGKLTARLMSFMSDSKLEIRIDSPKGKLLGLIQVGKTDGWKNIQINIAEVKGSHDLYLGYRSNKAKKNEDNGMMFDWFYFSPAFPGQDKPGYDSAFAHFMYLTDKAKAVTTPVMIENPGFMQRTTQVFERGNWLLKTVVVEPGVPASLNPMPKPDLKNRLGLALWITDKSNPLTSRTIVNRLWEQIFGQGLVETLEDMGTQGMAPTHPELLDHLAYKLMHNYRWSLKRLIRELVTSSTYRQSSVTDPLRSAKDPTNKYYSRGPRVRLNAEQLRDMALAVSGALNSEMYGPSVMPWQPPGIWSSPYNGDKWNNSYGTEKYRRALYTYWKRTSPYPSMLNFDAMAREVCAARRIRTNTPLQALTLMNDQAYLDISRQFSYSIEKETRNVESQIRLAWKRATGRNITEQNLAVLRKLYVSAIEKFQNDKDATCDINGMMDEHNNPQTAALIVTIHSIMNTDEVITKQ